MRYFMLNKQPGCICGRSDPEGRPTVYEHVPPHFPSLSHVGRLDFNTEGLLLFTDDGRLAQALLNRSYGPAATANCLPVERAPVEKVYHVKVRAELMADDPRLDELREPLVYPNGDVTQPARVRYVCPRSRSSWIEVVLTEGRHRQVRKLCERSGLLICKLRRIRLGPLELGSLKMRWCRPLTREEVEACYRAALPAEVPGPIEIIDDSPEAYAAARAAVYAG